MFFLNLTALEFFGLLGVLSATITALYFLDRTKRKRVVSTLQFWSGSGVAVQQRSRKRVSQPFSLLLQLVSLLLLLLAIAQLQIGQRLAPSRNHVLLVDTSAWSNARGKDGSVLGAEIRAATQYIAALPTQDRVLIAGVDALAIPFTGFLKDREQIASALRNLKPHLSALDLAGAFRFAEHAQGGADNSAGEVVYVGPAKISAAETSISAPPNLRVLATESINNNVGIRAASANAIENPQGTWQANIKLFNFGDHTQRVRVSVDFAGTPFAVRTVNLTPRQDSELTYRFVTNTAGLLTAKLDGSDSLPEDDRVSLELPGRGAVAVTAYSQRPEALRPLLQSNSSLRVKFELPSQYVPRPSADLVILDSFAPSQSPEVPSIWLNPPHLPPHLLAKAVLDKTSITGWNMDGLISSGLHSREQELTHATVFSDSPDYLPFAKTAEGPTVVLGQGQPRSAIVGFDPLQPKLRFTVLTPLLFANLIQWVVPELSGPSDVRAEQVGALTVPLMSGETTDNLRVTTRDGATPPFTVGEKSIQLFVDKPTTLRLRSGSRDQLLSLTLPNVGARSWEIPKVVKVGLPSPGLLPRQPLDLWKWLALSGALGLLAEWYLFGRSRSSVTRPSSRVLATVEQDEPQHVMFGR